MERFIFSASLIIKNIKQAYRKLSATLALIDIINKHDYLVQLSSMVILWLIIAEKALNIVIIGAGKSSTSCPLGAWVFLGLPF